MPAPLLSESLTSAANASLKKSSWWIEHRAGHSPRFAENATLFDHRDLIVACCPPLKTITLASAAIVFSTKVELRGKLDRIAVIDAVEVISRANFRQQRRTRSAAFIALTQRKLPARGLPAVRGGHQSPILGEPSPARAHR